MGASRELTAQRKRQEESRAARSNVAVEAHPSSSVDCGQEVVRKIGAARAVSGERALHGAPDQECKDRPTDKTSSIRRATSSALLFHFFRQCRQANSARTTELIRQGSSAVASPTWRRARDALRRIVLDKQAQQNIRVEANHPPRLL